MVAILAYHEIGRLSPGSSPVSAEAFAQQVEYLRHHGYKSMTIGQLTRLIQQGDRIPPKVVVLTFDDGTVDHFSVVFPILRDHGFVGTFYMTVGYVGTTRWAEITAPKRNIWYESCPPHFPERPETDKFRQFDFMSWSQVEEMHRSGMEIGSHTLRHPFLSSLAWQEAEYEIRVSKEILEQRLETGVVSFCYPYGDYNDIIVELLQKAGYTNASVTRSVGKNETLFGNRYTLARYPIGSSKKVVQYGLIVSGWDRRIRLIPGMENLLSIKRWLGIR